MADCLVAGSDRIWWDVGLADIIDMDMVEGDHRCQFTPFLLNSLFALTSNAANNKIFSIRPTARYSTNDTMEQGK